MSHNKQSLGLVNILDKSSMFLLTYDAYLSAEMPRSQGEEREEKGAIKRIAVG